MNFSLIIPTKDRHEILLKTLSYLDKAVGIADVQVIIINDSSQELHLPTYNFKYEICKNPSNGVAAGRNYGASRAKHEWLIFMDDDMLVQPEVLNRVSLFCIPENERNCLNVNWVYPDFLKNEYKKLPLLRYLRKYGFDSLKGWNHTDSWSEKNLNKANLITSQFLLINKKLFFDLGGYDQSFPFAGFEDHDLAIRIKKAGVSIFIDPVVSAYHNEADRLNVVSWLERRKRGAITRRVAVEKGYKDLSLNYPILKASVYKILSANKKLLLYLLNNWPNIKKADPIYFFLVNILFGTYSYEGYTKAK